jgi:hypothetical protein
MAQAHGFARRDVLVLRQAWRAPVVLADQVQLHQLIGQAVDLGRDLGNEPLVAQDLESALYARITL